MRIVFLDDGAYVATEPVAVSSYVVKPRHKDDADKLLRYGYMASKVLRPATADEVEAWRLSDE